MESVNKKILFGAGTISIGAFISKLLGAIYRIPLTNILGGEGIGLYQLVFPVYCLLLDFSSAGAPNAISKLVSSEYEENGYKIFKTSLKIFSLLGVVGSIILFIFSKPIAILQGNKNAFLGFIFISPAVFAVSILACFRGYFQGKFNMKITAVSQAIEQLVKLLIGLAVAYAFRFNIVYAVAGATFAVSVAEFVALIYAYTKYKRHKKTFGIGYIYEKTDYNKYSKQILKTALPITLIGIFIPLSQFVDSFLIVNLLGKYTVNSTALYGLYSGSALTLINLPISLLLGFSTVAVPSVSGAKTKLEREKKIAVVLLFTLILGIVFAFATNFFSRFAVNILYKGLSNTEREITVKLVKLGSANIVLLSLLQTENSILIGSGKTFLSLIGMSIGVVVKIALEIVLLSNPKINIYGASIALIACYFVASLVNLILVKKGGTKLANKTYCPKKLNN